MKQLMCSSHGRAVSLHAMSFAAFCIPGERLVAPACSLLNLVVASMVVTRFARPLLPGHEDLVRRAFDLKPSASSAGSKRARRMVFVLVVTMSLNDH